MKFQGIRYVFLTLGLCGILACSGSGTGANRYSKQDEVQMGLQYSAELNKQLKIMKDTMINNYVNQLGQKMVKQGLIDSQFEYTFHVVDSSEVNAFALPGGQVYINLALLKEAENEAELIGVVGHELGHVVHHHGAKRMSDAALAQGVSVFTQIIVGEKYGQLAGGLVSGVAGLSLLKYGRNAELEADVTGVDVLYRTGYNVQGLPGFFRKLQKIEKEKGVRGGGLSEMLSTHPPTADRIREAEKIIAKLPRQQNPKTTSAEFESLRKYIAPMKPSAPTPPKGGKA